MDFNFFENLKKLVISLHFLLSRNIEKQKLDLVEKKIFEFVEEIEKLYSPLIMKSGVHELLHLVDCTKKIGPLNISSCFTYEELNRKTLKLVKGRDMIGEEFQKIFYCNQLLNLFLESTKLKNPRVTEFIRRHYSLNSANRKAKHYNQVIKYDEKKKGLKSSNEIISKLKAELNFSDFEIIFLNQIIYKNVSYKIQGNESKFQNSCIITSDLNFGLIKHIFISKNEAYCICNKIVKLHNPFFDPRCLSFTVDFFK